jgi:hypothetical protein
LLFAFVLALAFVFAFFVVILRQRRRICFCKSFTMLSPQQKTPSFRPERSEVEKSASLPQPPTHPRRRTKSLLIPIILFTALTLSPAPIQAQGCTQCLDNTAATPPATQRAYRRAIILLTLTAGGLFLTTLTIFKRHR